MARSIQALQHSPSGRRVDSYMPLSGRRGFSGFPVNLTLQQGVV